MTPRFGRARRLLPAAAVVAVAVAAVLLLAAGGDGDRYRVRAIFDNAGFVIPGEDVKVAGVKVGKVESLDVTADDKAAIVLDIEHDGYKDFRADAACQVRPQSLIGERFVECEPTQKRAPGAAMPPPLREVDGERILPVERTSKAVDLDLVNNIMREPYRERLSIILNELGTGLAGRGRDLDEVVRRANPALKELDEVLAILAEQNRTLSGLARDSDTVLEPLARERRHVSGFVDRAGKVAAATVERGEDLEADLERLPRFLAELRPTMTRLGGLADQMTPVLADLGAVAPDVNRLVRETAPFARAGVPAFETLGETARVGIPALRDAHPVVRDLGALGRIARPVGATLADTLGSVQKTGGLQRAMDFIFYTVTAINGFDELGHYLRAALVINQCSNYVATPVGGCSAKFRPPEPEDEEAGEAKTSRKRRGGRGERRRGERRRRSGRRLGAQRRAAGVGGPDSGQAPLVPLSPTPTPGGPPPSGEQPPAEQPPAEQPPPQATPPAATPTPTPAPAKPTPASPDDAEELPEGALDPLLDYLFGGDDW